MRGRAFLVFRLAVKDLRHRPAQALLLLLAIAAATTTLTLGLALHGTTNNPYARTRSATNGPDVVATVMPGGSSAPAPTTTATPGGAVQRGPVLDAAAEAAALRPLEHAAGVAAFSGPFAVTWTSLRKGHTTGGAEVEGRNAAISTVDQPKQLRGSWIRPGGVVVEAGFASALGLHVGDQLTLGAATFQIVGTAATAAIPSYPDVCAEAEGCFIVGNVSSANPGLIWATEADASRIAGTDGPIAYFLNLKLNDAGAASAFADRYNADVSPSAPYLLSWQRIRSGDAQELAKVQIVLSLGSWLLALLAIASVAVLVGGRMAEQNRRVGLLKAVGGTPRVVAVVLLLEHVLVGMCAAGVGLAVGWVTAPLIDRPGAGLIGAPNAPSITAPTVGLVVALALAVGIFATFVPAVRAARQSTVAALNDSARPPRRRAWIIRLSAKLPAPLAAGHAPRCAASAATCAQHLQRCGYHERARHRAHHSCGFVELVARPAGDSGDDRHLSDAHRAGCGKRYFHCLDDCARCPTLSSACSRTWSYVATDHHRLDDRATTPRAARSAARHPRRHRHLQQPASHRADRTAQSALDRHGHRPDTARHCCAHRRPHSYRCTPSGRRDTAIGSCVNCLTPGRHCDRQ